MRNSWESCEKVKRKSQENHKKVVRESWEGHKKVMRKAWESHEKVMRNTWESLEKVMRKSCSHSVATRPSRCEFRAQKTAQNSQRESRSLCTELATRGSSLSRQSGYLFLSVGWGSAWGSSRRMQVYYVIPGSGVIVQIFRESVY